MRRENKTTIKHLSKALIGLSLLFCHSTKASWTQNKENSVFIQLETTWKSYTKMLGLPFVYVGGDLQKTSPVFSITPTGVFNNRIDKNNFDRKYSKYKEGRNKWLEKFGGKLKYFLPLKTENWKNVKNVRVAGFKYTLNKIDFTEKTYFISCQDQLFHAKALVRDEFHKGAISKIDKMLSSFDCKRSSK